MPGSDQSWPSSRAGDFTGLVAVLDPDVVLRSDGGARYPDASVVLRGVTAVTQRAVTFSRPGAVVRPVLLNGAAGVRVTVDGHPVSVMGFIVANGKIVEIDSLIDPERLAELDLTIVD
jgi:hypothetical protein